MDVPVNVTDWRTMAFVATHDYSDPLRADNDLFSQVVRVVTKASERMKPPKLIGTATITSTGKVLCTFEGRDGRKGIADLGQFETLVRKWRELAELLTQRFNMTDARRLDMFRALSEWVEHDNRSEAMKADHEKLLTSNWH